MCYMLMILSDVIEAENKIFLYQLVKYYFDAKRLFICLTVLTLLLDCVPLVNIGLYFISQGYLRII